MSFVSRTSAVVRRTATRLPRPLSSPLLWLVAAVGALYAVHALSRYRQFLTAGYDLGIFDQAVRAYSRFEAPTSALKGIDANLLGDHFHPILVVLAPLYWLWDDPRTLLLAQAVLVAAAVVPVWRFSRRRFGRLAAIAASSALAFGWPIQKLVDFDFHEVAFAVPLLAWAIDALDRRRDRELLVALALLLLVREDMGALVACVGVLYAVRRRRPARGALIAAGGLVAFVLIVKVVIPAIAGRDYGYWDYSVFGTDMASSIATVVADPGLTLTTFFTPLVKTQTLLALLAPLLLLPLLSPISLLALPILLERFLADRPALWSADFHYNAPVWVILCFAAVDGLARLRRLLARRPAAIKRVPALALVLLAAVPLLGSTALAPLTARMFPLSRMVTGDAFRWDAHMRDQAAILRLVPPSTCVISDDRMASHLTRTNRVTIPSIDGPVPDYYLLDLSQPVPSSTDEGWTSRDVLGLAQEAGYRLTERRGSMVLLAAGDGAEPSPGCAR
ncbi:DUF2079 domain-containing protein [Rathayibacter sp. VKM Ac-2803]|uniref:DUF2079 domain-containing protein n=1 Tax=Rathayibacter sp. VKM Ac-2803 TaxID=2609256 RepID=UPI00135716AC|nr:DUF2079 domain-containing protein [Rathayibacter sp. VKM Ac-2803]MWV48105.1 DUF2079 domain-containing protein [Rathayibacter sp. VKM Ac-2803]